MADATALNGSAAIRADSVSRSDAAGGRVAVQEPGKRGGFGGREHKLPLFSARTRVMLVPPHPLEAACLQCAQPASCRGRSRVHAPDDVDGVRPGWHRRSDRRARRTPRRLSDTASRRATSGARRPRNRSNSRFGDVHVIHVWSVPSFQDRGQCRRRRGARRARRARDRRHPGAAGSSRRADVPRRHAPGDHRRRRRRREGPARHRPEARGLRDRRAREVAGRATGGLRPGHRSRRTAGVPADHERGSSASGVPVTGRRGGTVPAARRRQRARVRRARRPGAGDRRRRSRPLAREHRLRADDADALRRHEDRARRSRGDHPYRRRGRYAAAVHDRSPAAARRHRSRPLFAAEPQGGWRLRGRRARVEHQPGHRRRPDHRRAPDRGEHGRHARRPRVRAARDRRAAWTQERGVRLGGVRPRHP